MRSPVSPVSPPARIRSLGGKQENWRLYRGQVEMEKRRRTQRKYALKEEEGAHMRQERKRNS